VQAALVDPIVHREISLLTLAQGTLSPAASAACDAVLNAIANRTGRKARRRAAAP
jgi:hypothetical protein